MPRPTMLRTLLPLLLLLTAPACAAAQDEGLRRAVDAYFADYRLPGYSPRDRMRADSLRLDAAARRLTVYANEAFCAQPFTPEALRSIYRDLSLRLPAPYNAYRLSIRAAGGAAVDDLIPNILREGETDRSRLWGAVDHKGYPWVTNTSLPYTVRHGLQGRHLMINPSHGRYYREGEWRWQRPNLFCTNEDLLTQDIAYPFLVPMLERAGAIVLTARERDAQTAECVIDNDTPGRQGSYAETSQPDMSWQPVAATPGFAPPATLLTDSTMPFTLGTARMVAATTRRSRPTRATWTPRIPRRGRYAVYVSYASVPGSVSDARYTVHHAGGRTQFRVNQQMGGGTWVYLGTFTFDEGERETGRVVLTNQSDYRGIVTADAVRFGGGVGQTERGEAGTSGMPRRLEGARYQAQWSGLPDTLFSRGDGTNDYNDDIRARSYLLNTFGGGSAYMPLTHGRGVPLELALALHTDAGASTDGSVYGTLGICTTIDGLGNRDFAAGMSRRAGLDLTHQLLSDVTADLSHTFAVNWTRREQWDRNYGETRTPDVPAAILEMFSHQNYGDMKYGHDPIFRFTLARAIYKALLRYVNYEHGTRRAVVQPLPPRAFAATLTGGGEALLSWQPRADSLAPDATPTGYIIYTKTGDGDFDNGTAVSAPNAAPASPMAARIPLSPGVLYTFRVTAINDGGESFPTEQLTVRRPVGERAPTVLIVNGFDRLSGPARVETADSLGFDLDADLGVPYLSTLSLAGRQRNFDAHMAGGEGEGSLGHSGGELAGCEIAGNTFDYPLLHAEAIAAEGRDYAIASCSRDALAEGNVDPAPYRVIDYICGLQRDAPQNLRPFKTFPAAIRTLLTGYLRSGGRLLASGSYIGSDMRESEERAFTRDLLKYEYAGTARTDSTGYIRGLNLRIPLRRTPCAEGYAVQAPDALRPAGSQAFTAFAYGGGQSAGTAYAGDDYRVIAMGFPFEAIPDPALRRQAMGALMRFLTE